MENKPKAKKPNGFSLHKGKRPAKRFYNKQEILDHLHGSLKTFRQLSFEEQRFINSKRLLPVEETMDLLQYWLENDGIMSDESPGGRYIGLEEYPLPD